MGIFKRKKKTDILKEAEQIVGEAHEAQAIKCPTCGSSNVVKVVRPLEGQKTWRYKQIFKQYRCRDCRNEFYL